MIKTRQLGLALVIFGVLVLVAVDFAYTYQQTTVSGFSSIPIISYPYRSDTFLLILLSIASFIIGFAFIAYRSKIENPIKLN